MKSSHDVPVVEHDEWGDQRHYQVINALSVVAALLALLSIAALVLDIFWIFPALGVIVSLVALNGIHKQPHIYTGKTLAVVSLLTCLILGGWSISHHKFVRSQLYTTAQQKVENWFTLIRDKDFERAHQLSMPVGMRAKGRTTLRQYYSNEQMARSEMNGFFSRSPMLDIVSLSQDWKLELAENKRIHFDKNDQLLVFQNYDITYQQDGEQLAIPVEVKMSRMYDPYSRASHWTVVTVLLLE